jgi:MarR family transcriptional regulator, organic hydroperoxide resistance regulator
MKGAESAGGGGVGRAGRRQGRDSKGQWMARNTKNQARMVAHLGARAEIQDDDHSEIFRQFVHNSMAFATRMQAIRKAFGRAIGLSGTQYTILTAILRRERKGGVGLNYIAERLHFTPAFATIEVNKLAAAGLVTKKENPDDRRRVLLSLTPQARELLRSLKPVQDPANGILFEGLSPDDFETMRDKMLQLVNNTTRALQLIEFLSGVPQIAVGDD